MDVREQFVVTQKYNHVHKVVQGQVPGEITPLLTLLFDLQLRHTTTCSGLRDHKDASFDNCHVTPHTPLSTPVRTANCRHTID
jgi:hypothetical protein